MNDGQMELFAAMAAGWVYQWALFGPKKVPVWAAWAALVVSTVALYWWATPTLASEWAASWRQSLVGLVQFFLAAKGTGSTAKAFKLAPGSNTL